MTAFASRQATAIAPTGERMARRVVPAVLVVYACMLPRELTIEIFDIAFQPFRLALTLMLPYALYLAAAQRMRPSLVDWLIVFASIWAFVALTVTEGIAVALNNGLSEGLNLLFAYFIGRAAIRTSKDFQKFFLAVLPGLLVCAAILATESSLHMPFFRPLVADVFGSVVDTFQRYETRLGFMRAQGPFPHPILGGVFMASFLAIAWYMTNRHSTRILGLLAVGGFFFSVSSTGFLAVIIAGGLIFTAFLHRVTRLPIFQAMITGILLMMIIIEAFSNSGIFSFIVRRLTLSSGTGYFRMAIWDFAGADAMNHPIFGIGLRPYIRPAWMITGSVDAHWLLLALRYGFPFGMAVLAAVLASTVMSLRGAWSPYPLDQRAAYAMGFSLIAVTFTGLSVYLWEGMGAWLAVLTGMGVSFGQQMAQATRAQAGSQVGRPMPRLRAGVA